MHKNMKSIAGGFLIPMALILGVQTAAPHFVSIHETEFAPPALHQIPYEIGTWQAHGDESLDRNVTEYLRPDEYVLRNYVDQSSGTTVNLFLAYFKSLQNAWGPHSPSICLPGAGWLVQSFTEQSLNVPAPTKSLPVNKFVLEKSGEKILVLYWYQNNRRIWADESEGKFRLVKDLAQYHRSDISLVRLVMPLRQGDPTVEYDRCVDFAKSIFPVLVERFASTN
jgi:EpsI family protein